MKTNIKIEILVIALITLVLFGIVFFELKDFYVTYGFVFLYSSYILGRYVERRVYKVESVK